MYRKGFSILALLLVALLSLGALAHAYLPHEHSPFEAITEAMHSAFRGEESTAPLLPLAYFAAVLISVALFLPLQLERRALLVSARDSKELALRRGTHAYRKFR